MKGRITYIAEQYDRESKEKTFHTGLISRNALEWAKKIGTQKDGDTIIIRKNNGEPVSGAIWEKNGRFYRRIRKAEKEFLWEQWWTQEEKQKAQETKRKNTIEETRRKLWETGFFA